MNKSVVAVFENRAQAEAAQKQLITSGLPADRVELILGTADGPSPGARPGDRADENESGIGNFFRSMFGMDDDDPSYYEEASRRGHATLIVHAASEDEAERARAILEESNVVDVHERGRAWRGDMPEKRESEIGSTDARGMDATIPVVEEHLQVGKREVQGGRVRVYTRVLERPVEASVNLREEHARVDRQAVDRPATEADLRAFKEGSMEIRERAEVPVVEKQARVVEEVRVGKQVEERTETVRDKVRKTEVQVEEEAPAAAKPGRTTPRGKPR
jgi:stress response protein YsnF